MTQKKVIDLLLSLIIEGEHKIKINQELIDEWNDPKDIAVRACEMVNKTHKIYVKGLYLAIIMLDKKLDTKFLKK